MNKSLYYSITLAHISQGYITSFIIFHGWFLFQFWMYFRTKYKFQIQFKMSLLAIIHYRRLNEIFFIQEHLLSIFWLLFYQKYNMKIWYIIFAVMLFTSVNCISGCVCGENGLCGPRNINWQLNRNQLIPRINGFKLCPVQLHFVQ